MTNGRLVFNGIIKARVPKAVQREFAAAAARRLKKTPELAREVFNAFLEREKFLTQTPPPTQPT